MGPLIYQLALSLYHSSIRLAALFSPKAKAWVDGRKDWKSALRKWKKLQAKDVAILWMHCASLGEFEQGRPVLERIRKHYPSYKIVLTFYSPSGYLQQKNYPHADYICYLPADHPANARFWVDTLDPAVAIFVKYEFWYFHLTALYQGAVPTYLIAASFRSEQLFFQSYGGMFKRLLRQFQHIFVQQQADLILLQQHGIHAVSVAGDPRVDRVFAIARQAVDYPALAAFKGQQQLFVAGSSWPIGEDMLLKNQNQWWTTDWKLLIAPHAIDEKHIEEIIAKIKLPYCRYSQLDDETDLSACRILILDTIGMLSGVYRYGDLAYIGGGFGRSIHNTLEPAAYGLPVIFGPRHEKFPEAVSLLQYGGGFLVESPDQFELIFNNLCIDANRKKAGLAIKQYISANQGASNKILAELAQQKALGTHT
jgi:3-deoxy-D-manno-octulosonic-acid transferase